MVQWCLRALYRRSILPFPTVLPPSTSFYAPPSSPSSAKSSSHTSSSHSSVQSQRARLRYSVRQQQNREFCDLDDLKTLMESRNLKCSHSVLVWNCQNLTQTEQVYELTELEGFWEPDIWNWFIEIVWIKLYSLRIFRVREGGNDELIHYNSIESLHDHIEFLLSFDEVHVQFQFVDTRTSHEDSRNHSDSRILIDGLEHPNVRGGLKTQIIIFNIII